MGRRIAIACAAFVVTLAMFTGTATAQTAPPPAPLHPPIYPPVPAPDAEALARQQAEAEQLRTDWPNLARYRAENAALPAPAANEKRVVFIGASTVEFWLRSRPEFFASGPYVDRGISGQSSAQILLRFQQDVIALKPAIVHVLVGTNDVAENRGPYDPDATLNNFRSMIEIAKANKVRFIIASVTPAAEIPWRQTITEPASKIAALNARLKTLALETGATYADYHTALATPQGGLPPELTTDGVHLTPSGYALIEPLARDAIVKALAQ